MCNRSRLTPVEVHARSFSIKRSIKSGEPVDAKARDSYTRGAKPDDGGTLVAGPIIRTKAIERGPSRRGSRFVSGSRSKQKTHA